MACEGARARARTNSARSFACRLHVLCRATQGIRQRRQPAAPPSPLNEYRAGQLIMSSLFVR